MRRGKSKVISCPASARPNGSPFRSTFRTPCSFAPSQPGRSSTDTATGEQAQAGFDWTKPKPFDSSPGMRVLSETSLSSITNRIARAASSGVAPIRTAPVITATSASKSMPQAGSPTMSSPGPRNPSDPPWYMSGSVQNEAGISAPRARRTSSTWFT
jgi:hypothetical protein